MDMKEYEIVMRKIDEEMERVAQQIEMFVDKRDNEHDRFTKLSFEDDVKRLIGNYSGLYTAWCIVHDLMRGENKK